MNEGRSLYYIRVVLHPGNTLQECLARGRWRVPKGAVIQSQWVYIHAVTFCIDFPNETSISRKIDSLCKKIARDPLVRSAEVIHNRRLMMERQKEKAAAAAAAESSQAEKRRNMFH